MAWSGTEGSALEERPGRRDLGTFIDGRTQARDGENGWEPHFSTLTTVHRSCKLNKDADKRGRMDIVGVDQLQTANEWNSGRSLERIPVRQPSCRRWRVNNHLETSGMMEGGMDDGMSDNGLGARKSQIGI